MENNMGKDSLLIKMELKYKVFGKMEKKND
jgi:hypothetical protein